MPTQDPDRPHVTWYGNDDIGDDSMTREPYDDQHVNYPFILFWAIVFALGFFALGVLRQIALPVIWPWIVEHSDGLLFALMMTVLVWLVSVVVRSD